MGRNDPQAAVAYHSMDSSQRANAIIFVTIMEWQEQ
jgi:hypothetical protein